MESETDGGIPYKAVIALVKEKKLTAKDLDAIHKELHDRHIPLIFDNSEEDEHDAPAFLDEDMIEDDDEEETKDWHKETASDFAAAGTGITDPVRLYLRECGATPLLTAEQEMNLAKTIEKGKLPDATEEEIIEAAKCANIHDFIMELPDQYDTFVGERGARLSGGQKQRVAIARAVVNKPRLLLLDESLSALDYKLRKQMQNELKALQRKLGITFVFVTHDQEEALTMSDRIVVMREGRIEQDGTPREIYEEPKNLFVAGFIGEINMFNATVIERLDEQRVRANVEGRECNIYVNFAVEPGQKLHVLLRPEDLRVEEINDDNHAEGLIGYVRERNYKGMTLESVVELENGKMVMVSEFFNEDDPDFDHSLDQKMAINWVESWEVVLADEEHK